MDNFVKFVCKGTSAILMHNSRLSDQFDPFAVAIKNITAKGTKKRTEEDALSMRWLEWAGSLYGSPHIADSDAKELVVVPIIPNSNILAFINDGAKCVNHGMDVWRGVQVVENHVPLENTGWPQKAKLLDIYKRGDFTDIRSVVVKGNRIQRCRPIFHTWEFRFTALFNPEILSRADLIDWVTKAGAIKGICDGTPRYGRSDVQVAA